MGRQIEIIFPTAAPILSKNEYAVPVALRHTKYDDTMEAYFLVEPILRGGKLRALVCISFCGTSSLAGTFI